MLVVSLTTIDSRIELLKKTITSLFYQTVQPDVIHVFYSNEPLFYDNGISDEIIQNINDELQLVNINKINIYFTKTKNIGPYRKLIPALKIYNDDIIITIDDDHEHEKTFIEQYMYLYNKYKCIICSGGRMYDLKTFVKNELIINIPEKISIMHIIPEGFGGILYHTSMFDEDFIHFDYSTLSNNILKNDDLYFRMYTFNKNIHVLFVYIEKNNLLDCQHQSLYENYNKNNNFSDTLLEISKTTNDINIIDSIEENINIIIQTDSFRSGTDVKILQYESFSINRCNNIIDLVQLLGKDDTNCIMINMEKDKHRYDSCIEEFKKISLKTFVHLKATYWKEKNKLLNDMIYILDFLKIDSKVSINIFSKFSDPNIFIQDGPLACYCAHVRALIYGHLNFKEYTIIVEDDLFISNTEKIEQYIQQIPDDWDIICLNACGINYNYGDEPFYKFKNTFHSTHFYIVKNKCLPTIFKNIYPIDDQIDILISRLYDRLNIYNIVDTAYQKNFATNTQNNLYVIFNSPNYQPIRNYIKEFEELLLEHVNNKLLNNHENNIVIRDCIMFDVVYNYIINTNTVTIENACKLVNNTPLYIKLHIIINSCVKGIHLNNIITKLLNDINYIIDCFDLHNDINKAYMYGSSANIYKCGDIVTKVYNQTLRWTHQEHDDSTKIFNKEVLFLQKLNRIVNLTENSFSIKYLGESLYNNFCLPSDWKEQIQNIFQELTNCTIEYPEFNIKNILVLDDKISFIDFGLAKVGSNNENNCKVFIELLKLLTTFKGEKELYSTFINNLKISGEYPNNIYI